MCIEIKESLYDVREEVDIKEGISYHLVANKDAKIVFIGPCTAKKEEILREEVKPYVDSVLTFEELLLNGISRLDVSNNSDSVEYIGALKLTL